MYSFCLPFLDATIRNVYFDGHVLEELICPCTGALRAAPPHPEDEHWEESMGLSEEYNRAYLGDSYRTATQTSTNRPLVPHPPSATISFRSFNQFVSSALKSSSIHSKVITSHLPLPLAISLTSSHTRAHLAEKPFHFIPPQGEFRTIVGWSPVSMEWRWGGSTVSAISRWLSCTLVWLINEDKLAFFPWTEMETFSLSSWRQPDDLACVEVCTSGRTGPFSSVFSVKTLMSKLPLNMSHEESRVGGV